MCARPVIGVTSILKLIRKVVSVRTVDVHHLTRLPNQRVCVVGL